jgi:hypothetical protein
MLAAAALAASLAAFAPVVVHDADERYPLASASAHAPIARVASDTRPAVYARAVPSRRGGEWLQYYLFYAGQDQDRGVLRTGRHEGDWELVQYRVAGGKPVEAVYAQHRGGERCGWSSVESRDGHPVVYPAHGSHASYFRSGTRDRLWPDPNDEADGRGAVVSPALVEVSAGSPRWMAYSGPWGRARARWWIPGEQDSPHGPAFQRGRRWSDPDAFADASRSCQANCNHVNACDAPERGLSLAFAAIPLLLLLVLRRYLTRTRTRRE